MTTTGVVIPCVPGEAWRDQVAIEQFRLAAPLQQIEGHVLNRPAGDVKAGAMFVQVLAPDHGTNDVPPVNYVASRWLQAEGSDHAQTMVVRGDVLLVDDDVPHLRVEQGVEAFESVTGARGV